MLNYIKIIFILFISFIHYSIINHLEKKIVHKFINNKIIYRPLPKCINKNAKNCLGLPSGHSETITIFSLLLYYQKIIPLYIALILIFLVGAQRIISNMHTFFQVCIGILCGIIYSSIYIYTSLSWISIIIMFIIAFIYYIISS
jgi:membrane-associated phospholipid phosphatase